jgi:hypothetical protein
VGRGLDTSGYDAIDLFVSDRKDTRPAQESVMLQWRIGIATINPSGGI